MKFIRIFLLVLIIIGIGLLLTQKIWVSKLVSIIIENENKNVVVQTISNIPTSSTTKKIVPNPTISTEETFPVPVLYPKYAWDLTSNEYKDRGPWPLISIYPEMDLSKLSSNGAYYEATNTDSGIKVWDEMVTNAPKDQDVGFYGGDEDFLKYYDTQLRNLGYDSSRIYIDKNLNIINENQPHYSFISIGDSDGPTGRSGGYMKYNKGKARIIIISSNTKRNSVFVSDIINIGDVILSSGVEPKPF